ncbi:hypothetical protein HETIRDRAFT_441838 [Heterobasidion irregulare TC 32-1]|uniref:Uncharacterized protein n=1 Tax=Heterobasidion irregulare (strain TC 32-1) TaxID=747525 RepID=W4JWI8_HETIT|nr:uncharacterized protein HETIRDRAFT_441838 [Heterobasidion irregulare TC 32-1]ETW77455.1 hypothetical protein HETIRDRAFT_441838 [Heterobasidion irregulare TC 32-1]
MPMIWRNHIGTSFSISHLLRRIIICLTTESSSSMSSPPSLSFLAYEEIWTANKDRLSTRVTTITIVAGLLSSATASFATMTPPVGSILNYNTRGSYICLLLAFGLTLGGLIVGSAMLFVTSKCTASWFRETLVASRSRICYTLVLIAYPFICIGVATSVGAIGLLVAV